MLFEGRPNGVKPLVNSLAFVLVQEISIFAWEGRLRILFLKGLYVLGGSRHHELKVDLLKLVGCFNNSLNLSVPVLSVLQEESVTEQDHDVFLVILAVGCLLGEIDELGGVSGGVVTIEVRVILDPVELLV